MNQNRIQVLPDDIQEMTSLQVPPTDGVVVS